MSGNKLQDLSDQPYTENVEYKVRLLFNSSLIMTRKAKYIMLFLVLLKP